MSHENSKLSGLTLERLDAGRLVRMHRYLDYPPLSDCQELRPAVEVTGRYWALAFGNTCGIAAAFSGDGLVTAPSAFMVFLPPFTIVEWRLRGTIRLQTVFGNQPLPDTCAHLPALMTTLPAEATPPESFVDVCALLESIHGYQRIDRALEPGGVARRLKEIIDHTYAAPRAFSAIAKDLKTSNAVLTRMFKRSYGLSPIEYRSQLRVAESLNHMVISGTSVGDAVQKVGFSDLKRFHSHFKREMGGVPSRFRLPKADT